MDTTYDHKKRTAEMIAVMQAYVDGKAIEHNIVPGGGWYPLSEPGWSWHLANYRIATIPDSINWDHVAPEWKWMARDASGDAYLFTEEPRLKTDAWGSSGYAVALCLSSYTRGTVDWQDSLVRRPE